MNVAALSQLLKLLAVKQVGEPRLKVKVKTWAGELFSVVKYWTSALCR